MAQTTENILLAIAAHAHERVAAAERELPLAELREKAEALPVSGERPFEAALARRGMSFICECKKASPSKGVIAERYPYLDIAREYEEAGAAAISCLAEPKWFLGSIEHVRDIAAHVDCPVLRKDFIVDEYLVYEARLAGAAAVLLICTLLEADALARYVQLADSLGMSALVEAHDERELEMALAAGARVVGVNNRNLADFSVDFSNSLRLRELAPADALFVAESGVRTPEHVKLLSDNGVDAALIGETLMRAPDKRAMLDELRSLL